MKEYLFYQNHKKNIQDHKRGVKKDKEVSWTSVSTMSSMSNYTSMSQTTNDFRKLMYQKKQEEHKAEEEKVKVQKNVLTEDTMRMSLEQISTKYEDKYLSAGFPPKICAEMVSNLCSMNPHHCKVLDMGCGRGCVGDYLKAEGFHYI